MITDAFGTGHDFTAIRVAYLGRLHPVGILLAGLLRAPTHIGGELAQLSLNLPSATVYRCSRGCCHSSCSASTC